MLLCVVFFFFLNICLWNRSLNSSNIKGMDWEFLAQSLMRLCNEPEWRAGLGENWPGKMLTLLGSQNWFRMDLQNSSRGHKERVPWWGAMGRG